MELVHGRQPRARHDRLRLIQNGDGVTGTFEDQPQGRAPTVGTVHGTHRGDELKLATSTGSQIMLNQDKHSVWTGTYVNRNGSMGTSKA